MKTLALKTQIFTLLSILFVLTACKKDEIICNSCTELTDKNHLLDITPLNQASAFNDSLTKYPQLQIYKVINDQYTLGMHCNVFYKGLKVFTNSYDLYLRKSTKEIYSLHSEIIDTLSFSLSPLIQSDSAISLAKQTMNYNKTCISYRLGIYDLNAAIGYSTPDYKLVWKVQGGEGFPFVVLDANNGQVYSKDDGIRY